MCGGGLGSSNDSSNDDESGSGNSFKETLANIFTPGDGFKYVDGQLTATNERSSYAPSVSSNDDSGVRNVQVYDQSGNTFNVRSDETKKYNQRLAGGLVGALTGGIPGMISGAAVNALTGGASGQSILNTANKVGSGIKSLTATPEFETKEEEEAYREKQRARHAAAHAAFASNKSDDGPGLSTSAPAAPLAPTVGTSDASAMSLAAGEGAFQAIPNPNYDPADPLSQMYLSNPTYAQLLAYRNDGTVPGMAGGGEVMEFLASFKGDPYERAERMQERMQEREKPEDSAEDNQSLLKQSLLLEYLLKLRSATGMAEGGEVMGGNEKTAISDAVSAVKGEMSEEQSALVLGQFLANYGEEALRDLVEKVQSGELDDTVERFANGEAGEVNGPGDGSGVDDKVPASLEGQQDVLLADGEFVLRKKTADALEKKYGGGFLDAVNEAENDAPRTMQQYMARN